MIKSEKIPSIVRRDTDMMQNSLLCDRFPSLESVHDANRFIARYWDLRSLRHFRRQGQPISSVLQFRFRRQGHDPRARKRPWGIGYYYLKISDHLPRILRARFGLDHEQGGEIYYNIQ